MDSSTSAEEDLESLWIANWTLIFRVMLLQKARGTSLVTTQASIVILCPVLTTSLFKKRRANCGRVQKRPLRAIAGLKNMRKDAMAKEKKAEAEI